MTNANLIHLEGNTEIKVDQLKNGYLKLIERIIFVFLHVMIGIKSIWKL